MRTIFMRMRTAKCSHNMLTAGARPFRSWYSSLVQLISALGEIIGAFFFVCGIWMLSGIAD